MTRQTDESSSSTRMRTSLERYRPVLSLGQGRDGAEATGSVSAGMSPSPLGCEAPLLTRKLTTCHSLLGQGEVDFGGTEEVAAGPPFDRLTGRSMAWRTARSSCSDRNGL